MKRVMLLFVPLLCSGCLFGHDEPDNENYIDESHLRKVLGDSQSARVGTFLPNAVQVRLDGANQNSPIGGVAVRWTVESGGGTTASAITLTNSRGESSVRWALGDGAVQRLRATVDIPGPDTSVVFSAHVYRLQKASGDSQAVGQTGSTEPLQVRLLDAAGVPRAGEVIRWRIDGGFLVDSTSIVGADGLASMPVRAAGNASLTPTTAIAALAQDPGDSIHFKVLTPYRLRALSGDNQSGRPGATLSLPLIVVYDDPATGELGQAAALEWEVMDGGGAVADSGMIWAGRTQFTNTWTLGPSVGVQHLRAIVRFSETTVTPIDTLILTATALQGAAGCGGVGTLHQGNGSYLPNSDTWTAAASPHVVRGIVRYDVNATLTIQPGATVCLENAAGIYVTRDLQAVGTPANPIRFLAADTSSPWGSITLGGPTTAPKSQISNARIEHAFSAIVAGTPVRIDSTIIRQSRNLAIIIQNSDTTNEVMHTTVDTTRGNNAAIVITAPGTRIASTVRGASTIGVLVNSNNVRLEGCEVAGSGSFGVFVGGFTGTVVTECNLTRNINYAVAAGAGAVIDARFNWWGNPAGPSGVANGVSAGVDASQPRASSAVLDYRPTW